MDVIKSINRIQRLGSSAGAVGSHAITIPADIARRINIARGEQFEVEWDAGNPDQIVLTRVNPDSNEGGDE